MGIENDLSKKGIYITKTEGDSMYPMLVSGKDKVVIKKPSFPLQKYDVPVYRRDGHYTMHRIIGFRNDGGYIICGDNRIHKEYDITENDIIGVLIGFYKDDKFISCDDEKYKQYSKRICRNYLLRYAKFRLKEIRNKIIFLIKKIKTQNR